MADQCTTVYVQKGQGESPPTGGDGSNNDSPTERGGFFKMARDNPLLVGGAVAGLGYLGIKGGGN